MTVLLGFAVTAGVVGDVIGVEQLARPKAASNADKRSALSLVRILCVSALAGTSKAAGTTFSFSKGVDHIEGNLQYGHDH